MSCDWYLGFEHLDIILIFYLRITKRRTCRYEFDGHFWITLRIENDSLVFATHVSEKLSSLIYHVIKKL